MVPVAVVTMVLLCCFPCPGATETLSLDLFHLLLYKGKPVSSYRASRSRGTKVPNGGNFNDMEY